MTWSFLVQGEHMSHFAEIREECADFAAHLKSEYGEDVDMSVLVGPGGWGGESDQDPTQPAHAEDQQLEHVEIVEKADGRAHQG